MDYFLLKETWIRIRKYKKRLQYDKNFEIKALHVVY